MFKAAGSYVSNFAPDITGIAADKAIIAGWQKANKGKQVGSFGPPTYGAVQILLTAIKTACTAGHGTITEAQRGRDRHEEGRRSRTSSSAARSSGTRRTSQDPAGAKFYIFQIQSDGSYKQVN